MPRVKREDAFKAILKGLDVDPDEAIKHVGLFGDELRYVPPKSEKTEEKEEEKEDDGTIEVSQVEASGEKTEKTEKTEVKQTEVKSEEKPASKKRSALDVVTGRSEKSSGTKDPEKMTDDELIKMLDKEMADELARS